MWKSLAEIADPEKSILSYGPKTIQMNYVINTQKGGTIFFMFFLMWYYNNFSLGAWVYLALHGSYGVMWCIKDYVFPDKSFQTKLKLTGLFSVALVLVLYWGIGFLMMSGMTDNKPSPERIFFCIFIYVIGLSLMLCADLQKYITLKYKKGLIDDFFLASNRNTNYLGEIILYSSFAFLVNHRYAFYYLITIWILMFGGRITLKEESLMKKDGYQRYKNNSYIILFKFFKSDLANYLFYLGFVGSLLYVYNYGGVEKFVKENFPNA